MAAQERCRAPSIHTYDDPFEDDAGGPADPDGLPAEVITELLVAPWFHGDVSRHEVQRLLECPNVPQSGAFLLRQASQKGQLAMSYTCGDEQQPRQYQHVAITFDPRRGLCTFGKVDFDSVQALLHHILARPVIQLNGKCTTLIHPIPRPDLDDDDDDESIIQPPPTPIPFHLTASGRATNTAGQKEPRLRDSADVSLVDMNAIYGDFKFDGFLTKLGHRRKNWKLRWFELRGVQLAYYKLRGDASCRGAIDLRGATSISRADGLQCCGKWNSLKLVIGTGSDCRAWHMFAREESEIEDWIKIIRAVMDANK